jgi:cysteine desulfurase / selenocysteine lyase
MNPTAQALKAAAGQPADVFDVERVRDDFPILKTMVHGKPLVYLDNAATTQKPRVVLDAIERFYVEQNSNVHRGVHWLSERATEAFEQAREKVAAFVNAASPAEIVFVRGTTEGLNLVAQTYGRTKIGPGDEIVISAMEHHSNIVPWQMLCQERGAKLRVVPINDDGEFLFDEYEKLLNARTKLVSVVHVSNALGTINPVKEVIAAAHERGVPVVVDGAQATAHLPIDVQDLDCDFYIFSGHKLFSPTGIGVLYGKSRWLEELPPWQGGGDMILTVSFEKTVYNKPPFKFEAGTPNIEGAIGIGVGIDYLTSVAGPALSAFEQELLDYGTSALRSLPGVRLIGTAREKTSVLSFVMEGVHPHDIGTILDQEAVAIRTGHHCAQPVMERFSVPATARASLALYNNRSDIDALVAALHKVRRLFG